MRNTALYNCIYIARCLKIKEKVLFNITSEASYVYILSGQKLAKNANIGQTVLPDRSVLIVQKLVEMPKLKKMRHFE